MTDADLFEHIWEQLEELDGPGDPSDELVECLLAVPEGVSQEQFDRVLGDVEAARDGDLPSGALDNKAERVH